MQARVVTPHRIPLNIFDLRAAGDHTPAARLGRVKFLNDALQKIYGGIGPRQRNHLKTAVLQGYENAPGNAPTLVDVLRQYEDVVGDRVDAPYSILSDLVDLEIFVDLATKAVHFNDFFTGVTVIDLASLGIGDRERNMLLVLLLNLYYEYMLNLEKRPYVGRDPQLRFIDSMLLVDEADNIMKYNFDVLRQILLQGRSSASASCSPPNTCRISARARSTIPTTAHVVRAQGAQRDGTRTRGHRSQPCADLHCRADQDAGRPRVPVQDVRRAGSIHPVLALPRHCRAVMNPAVDDGWTLILPDCVQERIRPNGLCCRDCLHRWPLRWPGLMFMGWPVDETTTRRRAAPGRVSERPRPSRPARRLERRRISRDRLLSHPVSHVTNPVRRSKRATRSCLTSLAHCRSFATCRTSEVLRYCDLIGDWGQGSAIE